MTIQNLKLKVPANFPASVVGAGGLAVAKTNGVWTVQPDFTQLGLITASSVVGSKEIWVRDQATGVYNRVTLRSIVDALGQTAGAIAISYTYDSTMTDADPGPGKLRLNNAATQ